MLTKRLNRPRHFPTYPVRFGFGMLVLLLTLLLIFTAVGPGFRHLFNDDSCEIAANYSPDNFSAETAVPDCWLIQ